MSRYASVCVLTVMVACLQTMHSNSALAAQGPPAGGAVQAKAAVSEQKDDKKAAFGPDAPVITIEGLCDSPSAGRPANKNCKTVITRAQFEKIIEAIQPGMPERARRDFALRYVDFLVMSKKAQEIGLDKGTSYEEQMKLARIQILSKEFTQTLQKKASEISGQDIAEYYRMNSAKFETAEMDRIFIPKTRRATPSSDATLSDAGKQQSEELMKEEADKLHKRALAGEELSKLQAEAYEVAGITSAVPNTSMKIRRISLPSTEVSVMDLKPGEVSPVLSDGSGYVIYRLKTKETLPLDQARQEIEATLRYQRIQEEMDGIQDSVNSTLAEGYFLPGTPK